MTLPRKGRVSIPDGVMVRELEGESVLLNLDSEAYFGLDDVGTRMWSALMESGTIETAYETLLAEYDATPEQLQADLGDFVEQLAASGLIDVREG
jgi:hypothetical protein